MGAAMILLNRFLIVAVMALWLFGCAAPGGLIETQTALPDRCRVLGVISETANPEVLSIIVARRNMVKRVEKRAKQIGATHIEWLHRTDHAAAVRTYRCE